MPNDVMDATAQTGVPSGASEDAAKQAVAADSDGSMATAAAGSGDDAKTPIPPAQIADLDPRTLVGLNPKLRDYVAGVEGSALQRGRADGERRTREALSTQRAQEEEKARRAELSALRDADPYAYADRTRELDAEADARAGREAAAQREQERLLSVSDQYDNVLLGAVELIPEDFRAPVAREYPGTIEGRQQLVTDLIHAARESGQATAVQQYQTELAAAQAELANERMKNAVRPSFESGPAGTSEDISKIKGPGRGLALIKRGLGIN